MTQTTQHNRDMELEEKMKAAKKRAKAAADAAILRAKKARESSDENIDEDDKYINKVDKTNDFIMEGKDPHDCY